MFKNVCIHGHIWGSFISWYFLGLLIIKTELFANQNFVKKWRRSLFCKNCEFSIARICDSRKTGYFSDQVDLGKTGWLAILWKIDKNLAVSTQNILTTLSLKSKQKQHMAVVLRKDSHFWRLGTATISLNEVSAGGGVTSRSRGKITKIVGLKSVKSSYL